MSDAPHVPPPVAHALALGELALRPPVADGLASLTGRVRDMAARAAAAAGRVQALAPGHPVLDARDASHAELAAARGQLCDAVGMLAVRLRRDGLPPQRMLVAVKDAVRAAAPTADEVLAAREVMGDAVRWGIDAYYAAAS